MKKRALTNCRSHLVPPDHPPQELLFADQNKDARCQRDKVEQEYGRPKIHAKPQQTINDQINRKQNHADASIRFHALSLLDRAAADNPKIFRRSGTIEASIANRSLPGASGVDQMRSNFAIHRFFQVLHREMAW